MLHIQAFLNMEVSLNIYFFGRIKILLYCSVVQQRKIKMSYRMSYTEEFVHSHWIR